MENTITNGFQKINNPQLQPNAHFQYDGDINAFDFEKDVPSQLKNYTAIKKLLNDKQIDFTEINIVRWNAVSGRYGSKARCKFIVKTTIPELLWYKSESNAPGSGHNQIYYKKQKIKTTDFIKWNGEKLAELLEQ